MVAYLAIVVALATLQGSIASETSPSSDDDITRSDDVDAATHAGGSFGTVNNNLALSTPASGRLTPELVGTVPLTKLKRVFYHATPGNSGDAGYLPQETQLTIRSSARSEITLHNFDGTMDTFMLEANHPYEMDHASVKRRIQIAATSKPATGTLIERVLSGTGTLKVHLRSQLTSGQYVWNRQQYIRANQNDRVDIVPRSKSNNDQWLVLMLHAPRPSGTFTVNKLQVEPDSDSTLIVTPVTCKEPTWNSYQHNISILTSYFTP